MMQIRERFSYWAHGNVVALAVWLVALSPFGAVSQEVDERAQIERLIEKRVALETEKQFNPKRIAERLKFGWPIKPPAMTRAQVREKIEKAVSTAVDTKHPVSRLEEIKEEAEEKYGVYQPGEKVSFVIRGGLGPNTHVEGWLREITDDRICVGGRWILRSDMTKEDIARFDEDISREKIEGYVSGRTRHFHAVREQFEKRAREVVTPRIYEAGGYINVRGQWATRQELFAHVAKVEQGKLRAALTKELTEKIYTENGYVLNPQSGEWMPKSALDRVSGGIASLFGGGDGDAVDTRPAPPLTQPVENVPDQGADEGTAETTPATADEGDSPREDGDAEGDGGNDAESDAEDDIGTDGEDGSLDDAGDDQELTAEELAELGEMADEAVAQGVRGLGAIVAVFFVICALLFFPAAYCLSLICRKAGTEPGVLIWIPLLQIIPLFRAADLPLWMIGLFFVPVVNIAMPLLLWWKLCEARGKPAFLGLFIIVPGVNLVLVLYLAFSGPTLGE